MASPRVHALLIGIDGYLPNRRPGGVSYPPLSACVHDVRAAEQFLRTQLGVPAEQIEILLAPERGTEGLAPASLPTYENIVGAWRRLIERAAPGDQVFIHYSGHGGRATTIVPKLKSHKGLDECLVPWDYAASARPRYLRDLEINPLLAALAEREVFTTLVLDCCHSGGASRLNVKVRGVAEIDRSEPATDSLVAPFEVLSADVSRPTRRVASGFRADDGFVNEPYGYVLFAACRPQEMAIEAKFDTLPRGALSYWFFRLLERAEPGMTYRRLYEMLLARIQGQFVCQTPLLEGERDRRLFGRDAGVRPRGVPVDALDEQAPGERIRLRSGAAQGLGAGARVVVLAPEAPVGEGRLAMGEVCELAAATAWVRISEREKGARPPQVGDEAVVVDPGELRLKRPVLARDERGRELVAALGGLGPRLGSFFHLSPEPAADEEPEALDGFFVWVEADGELRIGDAAGLPLEVFPSTLRWGQPEDLERFARRLDHLARFRNVLAFENDAFDAGLRGALDCQVARLPEGYQRDRPLRPKPFPARQVPPSVKVGEWICLAAESRWREPLNVTVLDLAPNGEIRQIHPNAAVRSQEVLEPGRPLRLPLRAALPPGYAHGRDVLKVFASRQPLSFRWLELPAFDQPLFQHGALRGEAKPLDRLFAALAAEAPATRGFMPPAEGCDDWWVDTLTVEVVY